MSISGISGASSLYSVQNLQSAQQTQSTSLDPDNDGDTDPAGGVDNNDGHSTSVNTLSTSGTGQYINTLA